MEEQSKAVEPQPEPASITKGEREWWPLPLLPSLAAVMRDLAPFPSLGALMRDLEGRGIIAVDEFTEDGTLVVRAEMPGLDPDTDVEITVCDSELRIRAEHTQTEERSGRYFQCRELRSGSFVRTIGLPEGVEPADVNASYKDGILEVRVPVPVSSEKTEATRIPVSRS